MEIYLFKHPRLKLALHWDGSYATLIQLNPDKNNAYSLHPPRQVISFFNQMTNYLDGNNVHFALPLKLENTSEFAKKIFTVLLQTKPGETISYSQLAKLAGKPKAARAVGRIVARNRFPVVIPCHRIIGANGALTGYGGGLELKKKLLAIEKDMAK